MAANKVIVRAPFVAGELRFIGFANLRYTFKCIDCQADFDTPSGHADRCEGCAAAHHTDYNRRYSAKRRAKGKKL